MADKSSTAPEAKAEQPSKKETSDTSPKRYPGRPLQIIRVEEKGADNKSREIALDEGALKEVLANVEKTGIKKMYIVSLVGAMRTGKSFMLDLFLRYLTEDEKKVVADPMAVFNGPNMNHEKESQFYWRAHEQRTTTGIWFYSHPFVRTIKGTKVCILLMDTQGLFDPLSPPEINNAIFGLSVLLSSLQILNVQNRIQEDTLQQLDYFTSFANSAIAILKKSENEATGAADSEEKDGMGKHKFQMLRFLVRDWANFDDPENVDENLKQTTNVLSETMRENFDDEGQRDRILKSFDEVNAFFLPHIGLKAIRKKFDGDLSVLDPGFTKMTSHFLRNVFDETVVVKRDLVRGIELDPRALGFYIQSFIKVFKDGSLPQATTLVGALTMATTLQASEEALTTYRHVMDDVAGTGKPYVKELILKSHAEKALEKAREEFDRIASYGDQEVRKQALEEVLKKIKAEWARYEDANRNRVDKILAGYAVLLVVAGVAFTMDFVSDYTCDWWLDTCRQGSRLAKIVYTLVAGFIIMQVVMIYNEDGKIITFKALGGLWAEATRLFFEYYETVKNSEISKEMGFDGVMEMVESKAGKTKVEDEGKKKK